MNTNDLLDITSYDSPSECLLAHCSYEVQATKKVPENSETFILGAENETRTRDPNLGKVVLYQLSYFRISVCVSRC